MCSAPGEGKSSEGSERRRRVKGALFSPLVPRWDTQAPRSCGPARVAYLLLPRRGEPKRGAASRASEASRLASTWAAEKFAQTHRERLAAPDSGDRCEFEVCGWSPGLATPGGAPAAAASGMLRARR